MIDKENLCYDLALQVAAVMTLRDNSGNPPDKMLVNFDVTYSRYGGLELQELFKSIAEKVAPSK